ncbi:MAG: hypothetical protein ACI90V_009149, partial [Bacillariaceae sp.]
FHRRFYQNSTLNLIIIIIICYITARLEEISRICD